MPELTQTLRVTSGFQKLCTWTSTYKQIVSLWNIFFIFCYRKADPSWWENMTKTCRVASKNCEITEHQYHGTLLLRWHDLSSKWRTMPTYTGITSVSRGQGLCSLEWTSVIEQWQPADCLISEVKMSFTREIAKLVTDNQIPDDMVINFDQTPIQYCPSSRYTMAPKGSSKISINGAADKRSLTALVAVTMRRG